VTHASIAPEAQAIAERVGARMFDDDRASAALGMRVASIAPGRAEMTMTVRDDMLNGHRICHGGFIFLLADSTFAFACNSYNRNTVAQGCSIEYLAPAHGGDVLRAIGVEGPIREYYLVPFTEPFARVLNQGMVVNEGAALSKSRGNVVEPGPLMDRWGADSIRTTMLFAGPVEAICCCWSWISRRVALTSAASSSSIAR